jgi:hypothetical protein
MQPNMQKQQVQQAFQNPANPQVVVPPTTPTPLVVPTAAQTADAFGAPVAPPSAVPPPPKDHKPFFIGTIKNGKRIPLAGILLYVKNTQNQPVRLLKTNEHGIFATFNPLPAGEYIFEIKDPKSSYLFDTMKITIQDSNPSPIDFYSKELI